MIGNINIRVSGDSNSVDVFGEDMAEVVFSDAGFAQVAAANGYIKADDYEALQKRLDELVNFIDGLDEDAIALANGYVKLADDEIIAKRLTSGEICFGSVNVDQVARKFGYVKLQPGTIQIKIEDAETLMEWFNDMVPPPWITQACERVRAALEATHERDE